MEFLITQKTKVKIGKKSLSQVQGLFLAIMDAISKGDAKDMFSSIENLRNAVDEKQPVVKRVAPFAVVLEDLVNMVENSTNGKARAYKIAKIKELVSSLEEEGVKDSDEGDTVYSGRLCTAIRKLFEPYFEKPINTHTIWVAISTFMGENVDVKTLDSILKGMGYLHSTDKDNGNFYCIALKPNYQYLLQPEYVPSEGDVILKMPEN